MAFIKKKKINGAIYLVEVKSVREGNKVRHKYLRYIGKQPDEKNILELNETLSVGKVKINATLLVLNHIAMEIGLHEILGDHSKIILCLVFAHCINYQSLNKMESWFKKTNIGYALGIQNLSERALLSALDDLESKNLSFLQQMIFLAVKRKYHIKSSGIIYDVTNTYFHGKRCSLGRLGKSKEGKNGNPLIQIGLGTTEKDGIPVFHKVFKGNVHDSRTFADMVTDFEDFGISNGIFVFDRGISSAFIQNILKHLGWEVICGLKMDKSLKEIVRQVKQKEDYQSFKNRVDSNGTIFYVTLKPHTIGDVKGILAVCFNPRKALRERESLLTELAEAKIQIKNGEVIKEGLQGLFSKNGKILTNKAEETLEFKGFSLIFTTKKTLTSSEIIRNYFDKDLIEKSFQVLKGILKLRPIRHWLSNRVIAHVCVCYLAYLILSLMQYKLKPLGMTTARALEELDMAYKIHVDNPKAKTESRMVTQTKTQQSILKALAPALLK